MDLTSSSAAAGHKPYVHLLDTFHPANHPVRLVGEVICHTSDRPSLFLSATALAVQEEHTLSREESSTAPGSRSPSPISRPRRPTSTASRPSD
jgi:hypothetical protein